jgi:hypothetical protein
MGVHLGIYWINIKKQEKQFVGGGELGFKIRIDSLLIDYSFYWDFVRIVRIFTLKISRLFSNDSSFSNFLETSSTDYPVSIIFRASSSCASVLLDVPPFLPFSLLTQIKPFLKREVDVLQN